ncbi:MAG TPA: aspartate 1-decarboxylase [Armatimonadetes bacterium]|nr:aspartate 1-decarboxylase [Armatimonadota bacterium]
MLRPFCRAKIHRATITAADLDYIGSLTLDADLMAAAELLPFEQVQVANVSTGARFETYLLEGEPGSGVVCLNGAAARLGQPGDVIIIFAYAWLNPDELRDFRPRTIFVDEHNRITEVRETTLWETTPLSGFPG